MLNASLWDVMSTGLADYDAKQVKANAPKLQTAFFALLKDETFNRSITYGPNDKKQVYYRFEKSRAMFQEVFGAHAT